MKIQYSSTLIFIICGVALVFATWMANGCLLEEPAAFKAVGSYGAMK
jgi:hypothetical protein